MGDLAGEAVTLNNIGRGHEVLQAIAELELVVELDRQVGSPDLELDTVTLEEVRQERAQI